MAEGRHVKGWFSLSLERLTIANVTFPSHSVCYPWRQRQLTPDKQCLHYPERTCDPTKGVSCLRPTPGMGKQARI